MSALYSKSRLISVLTVSIFLFACQQSDPKQSEDPPVRPAKIFTVEDPSGSTIRNFPAEVEANADSQLAFRVSGQVIEFPVKAGNEVTKGQLLARLDPTDFKLRLDDRQARYDLAKSQYERAKSLLAKKLASQSTFDEAKANLGVAESSLNTAKSELEYTYLRAPFDGSVAKVMVEKHENIQAKQTILALQTRDQVDISIQIPENIISRAKKDSNYQPTVVFDSHKDQEFLVSIKEWDTQADPSTLTYKVVFSLPAPENFTVLPGMTANLKIDLSKVTDITQKGLLIPVGAVFTDDSAGLSSGKKFVWIVDANLKVSKAEVTVGEIKSNGIEITSGVKPGDKLIAAGVHYITEGMQVRPWNREKGL